ncbi:MAG: Uma2 family endonuclease [Ktedonobacteraceae bacterium]
MEQPLQDEVLYYYDVHPTREDLMGETFPHARLVHYLMEVLTWLLRVQTCAIYENFNFYQTSDENEYPLVPDIAVIKGESEPATRSYRIGVYGPPPQVVFEFASSETWKRDLQEKPGEYDRMGVEEYYAYDPNQPPLSLSRRRGRRLFGWQLDRKTGVLREIPLDGNGRLWSPLLQSYLVPDGTYLRFSDRFGNQCLTQAEEEKRRAEVMAKKLRELGIDPDQLV